MSPVTSELTRILRVIGFFSGLIKHVIRGLSLASLLMAFGQKMPAQPPYNVTLVQPGELGGVTVGNIVPVYWNPAQRTWNIRVRLVEATAIFQYPNNPSLYGSLAGTTTVDHSQTAFWLDGAGGSYLGQWEQTVTVVPSAYNWFMVGNDNGEVEIDYHAPGIPDPTLLNSGYYSAPGVQTQNIVRLSNPRDPGGSIQLSTGAESAARTLFTFHGARDWSFAIHYNSILAASQQAPGSLGYGWTHDFEPQIVSTTTGLRLLWDPSRSNSFSPVTGQPSIFTSTDDGAQYDTIYSQSGGGWLLVRKDQSSKKFNVYGQLVQDIDPNGRVLNLSYSASLYGLGVLQSITDPISNTSLSFTYDAYGTIASVTDALGATATLAYSYSTQTGQGIPSTLRVLSKITNQNGYSVSLTYNNDAQVAQELDNAGNVLTSNTYDSNGDVTSQLEGYGTYKVGRSGAGTLPASYQTTVNLTDRDGNVLTNTYDGNFNLLKTVGVGAGSQPEQDFTYDGNNNMVSGGYVGQISTYTYDAFGNLLTSTDPLGNKTTFTYDGRNNLLTETDASNATTTFAYDSNNNILSIKDPLGNSTTWTYNSDSLPLTKTIPGGGVFTYSYTAGRMTQVTDPNGIVTSFGYDADGRVLSSQDALGDRDQYTYDSIGNVLTVTNALNQTFTYTYDFRNRIAILTDPSGAVTSNTYDIDNNLITLTDPLGNVTTNTYDFEDRLVASVDPLVRTTGYSNDAAGRVSKITAPGGATTTFAYNAANELVNWTDALGQLHAYTYDARGLPLTSTDPLNRTTTRTFDNVGRLSAVTDPLSRTTHLTYDALRRLTQVTDPGNLVAIQQFDPNSNRTSCTDPASHSTGFAYDPGCRIVSTTTPVGNAMGFGYDSQRGLLTSFTLPNGNPTALAYDAADRLNSTSDGIGSQTYTRDSLGRLLKVTENGKTLTRAFDAMGRMVSYTDGAGNVIGYQYDAIGRLTTLTYPNGGQVQYAYDAAGNLSTVTDWAGRVTTYSHDALNRLTQMVRPNGTKQIRTYDAASQVVQVTELAPDGSTVIFSGTYGYDAGGQMTSETTVPGPPAAVANSAQTFDADNRLISHNGSSATSDANGNLLAVASGLVPAAYSYDARNRLISAGTLTYAYDAENRRVSLTDSTGTTQFAVNPNAPLAQVLVRTSPSGTQTYYVYGVGLLYEQTGSLVSYYHSDYRGDTVALTDVNGNVTDTATYDVYGAITSRTGLSITPFLFCGLYGVQTDSNGIYYQRNRYYSPILRRFLNQDCVLGNVVTPQSLNRFSYADGNPVSLVDPFGTLATDPGPNRVAKSAWLQSAIDDFFGPGSSLPRYLSGTPFGTEVGALDNSTQSFARGDKLMGTLNALVAAGTAAGTVLMVTPFGLEESGTFAAEGSTISAEGGVLSADGGTLAADESTILANNAAGKAAEALAKADLEESGYTVLGSNVTARTSEGIRYIDHLVDVDGNPFAVEVKSGDAVRSASQLLKDTAMEIEGATLSGPNVPAALQGRVLKIPTVEMRYP